MFKFEFLLILSVSSQVSCFLYTNTTSCHSFRISSAYSLRLSSDWIIWQNVQSHIGAMSLQGWCDGIDMQSMCSRLPAKSIAHCAMHQWVAHQSRFQESLLNVLFSSEIPRVINMMMTQNEAPEPPNEDPTYERYQSSEQRGECELTFYYVALKLYRNIVSRLECLSSGWVNQLMLKNGFSNFPSLRYLITSPEWNFAFRNSIKIWHRKVRRRWSGGAKRWRDNKQLPRARG